MSILELGYFNKIVQEIFVGWLELDILYFGLLLIHKAVDSLTEKRMIFEKHEFIMC